MKISKPSVMSKARFLIDSEIKKVHTQYKGQHHFLNALFHSPGDGYYCYSDKSRTNNAVSALQSKLLTKEFNVIFTDVEFDANMNLTYVFEVESPNWGASRTIRHRFKNAKATSLIKFKSLID